MQLFVEQLHSRGVFWRIRGGPPGGAAGSAVELGTRDSAARRTTTLTRRVLEDSSFRNPHPVGYGVSVTHTLCPMWVRGRPSSEPTNLWSFIFGVSFSGVVLAYGPRFLVL